jgi:hypothetical protein
MKKNSVPTGEEPIEQRFTKIFGNFVSGVVEIPLGREGVKDIVIVKKSITDFSEIAKAQIYDIVVNSIT